MACNEDSRLLDKFPSQVGVWTLMSVSVSCLGTLSMGMGLAYSSPVISDLTAAGALDDYQASWFGSLLNLGAFFGGLIGGYVVEVAGRKGCLILTGLPFVVGWLLILCGPPLNYLYTGRLLVGIGAGMSSLAVSIYVTEVAPRQCRGALGSGFQLSATCGMLLVYGLGMVLNWQWIAVSCAIPPTCLAIFMVFMPESPRWLLAKGYGNDALANLACLRNTSRESTLLQKELEDMEATIFTSNQTSFSEMLSTPKYSRPFLITMSIMVFQQAIGINGIIFYIQPFLERAGFGNSGAMFSLAFGLLQVAGVILSCFLADRAGRRSLLMISGFVTSVSCFMFGLYYLAVANNKNDSQKLHWLALGSLVLYIGGYSVGWGSLTRVVTSEIVPYRIRGITTGIGTSVNWAMSFLVTKVFNMLLVNLHGFGLFWIFSIVALCSVLFVFKCLPETMGCSLEDIEREFEGRRIDQTEMEDRNSCSSSNCSSKPSIASSGILDQSRPSTPPGIQGRPH